MPNVHDEAPPTDHVAAPGTPARCWCGGALGPSPHPLYGRCDRCGTMALLRQPSAEALERFYTLDGYWREHQAKDLHIPTIEERAVNDFKDRIPVWYDLVQRYHPDPKSLLEIGCGHGGFLAYCRQRGMRAQLVGVEVDAATCAFARRRFDLEHVACGLFPDVALPRDRFEVIVGFDVLEHFLDPVGAIRAVADRLDEDGLAIFQTPSYRGEGAGWMHFNAPEHTFLFNEQSAARLFRGAGLRVEAILPGYFWPDMFIVARRAAPVARVLWVRPDAIGDNVIAASTLPAIAGHFADARLTVVCQGHVAPLYERCPWVSEVIAIDKPRAYADEAYRSELAARVRGVNADVCLHAVYSREPIGDFLALASGSPIRATHAGDAVNMAPDAWAANNQRYTHLLPQAAAGRTEIGRHAAFLASLGVAPSMRSSLQPLAWTGAEDAREADELFAANGLTAGRTVALFGGAQFAMRTYAGYGAAVARACRERGLAVVALGAASDAEVNRRNLAALDGVHVVDLSGRTSLRVTVEVLKRCCLAVGSETGLAHMACAAGTPNVILLGGGHFGRFMPYSPLTSVVCLPLACFGCNWSLRYARPHCVKDVSPGALAVAVEDALAASAPAAGAKPRVYMEDRWSWSPGAGEPEWGPPHPWVDRAAVELVSVGRSGTWDPEVRDGAGDTGAADAVGGRFGQTLRWPWRHRPESGLPPVAGASAARAAAVVLIAGTPLDELLARHAGDVAGVLADTRTRNSPATRDEWHLLDEILAVMARETHGAAPPFLQYHFAAAAYLLPHEVPVTLPLRDVPEAVLPAYLQYALAAPEVFSETGEAARFAAYLERRLVELAELVDGVGAAGAVDERFVRLLPQIAAQVNVIAAYFGPGDLRELMRARGRILEACLRHLGADLRLEPDAWPASQRPDHERIRVGIILNQFVEHTETYATIPAFETLDRARFHVTLYALRETGTPIEAWCRRHADRFVILPQALDRRVQAIRADELDVAFFGMNLTAVTHDVTLLAAHRLARAQATSICCPVTTGLAAVDYFLLGLGGRDVAAAQAGYCERLVPLPEPGMAFRSPERPSPTPGFAVTRAGLGIRENALVFASGANFFKVIPELRAAWARLCAAVPNSVLLLYPFGPAWSSQYAVEPFVRQFQATFAAHGVEPTRLVFAKPLPSAGDIPALLALADVYLDSFPYSGALSALDALGAGLPVVTMDGDNQRGHQCAQLLRALRVDERCVAAPGDEADYRRRAVALATDPSLRRQTAADVRAAMAAGPAFFDSAAYGREVARAFERMLEGAPSQHGYDRAR